MWICDLQYNLNELLIYILFRVGDETRDHTPGSSPSDAWPLATGWRWSGGEPIQCINDDFVSLSNDTTALKRDSQQMSPNPVGSSIFWFSLNSWNIYQTSCTCKFFMPVIVVKNTLLYYLFFITVVVVYCCITLKNRSRYLIYYCEHFL